MIHYTQGNLLDSTAEVLVNTVNTVGVMGKGIALMFKERFPFNMQAYAQACKAKEVKTGQMFVTETLDLIGPKWIVNFPTKQHWRNPSKLEWIETGLQDLRKFLIKSQAQSIAIPPLGAGNGGLDWNQVKPLIVDALGDLPIDIYIYEPTTQYQNVTKSQGVEELTPERAMMVELIRRYLLLGIECSLLEAQKLAWFLDRVINKHKLPNKLRFNFTAHNYGPYSNNLSHLLSKLDCTYIYASKRIPDASPLDTIDFINEKKSVVEEYLNTEAQEYLPALHSAIDIIDGFESPYGMELLATVDWLISKEGYEPNLSSIKQGISNWKAGSKWAERKLKMFDDRSIKLALDQLSSL